jgi:hypothetical protein
MGTHIQNFASFTERIKANKVVQEQSKKSDTQEQYSTFFKKMLQKYDISSPAELKSDEEKKKFFDEVSAGWDKESSKPTTKGKEILNENTGEINESAFAIAGGIILAVMGLNAIRSLVNRVLVGIGKNVEIEPDKLKTLVREMSSEALSVGLNTKDSSIINNWQRKVESLIDAGEIKTLGQVEKYMDTDLKTEIFESVVNEEEINNDDEFRAYAETVLKKMHGSEYDANKAKEVIDGLLSKKDGNDYGAIVGMLNKG